MTSSLRAEPESRDAAAEQVLRRYIRDPHSFWKGPAVRQADKLVAHRSRWAQQQGWSADDLADRIVALARERAPNPPLYVTGLGGSGSHWLAAMLSATGRFFNAGEVYVPPALADALDSDPAAPEIVDALHLLHRTDDSFDGPQRAVNSAAGARWTGRRRAWDPQATVAYLIRDPRDQVLSSSFRKEEYRRYVADGSDDATYLSMRCELNRRDRRGYVGEGVAADVTVRYESLRSDPVGELSRVLAAAGEAVDGSVVGRAAKRHDPVRILRGDEAPAGNLHLTNGLSTWQEQLPKWVTVIHAELADVIEDLAYPFGSCLIAPGGTPTEPPRAVPHGIRVHGWSRGTWTTSAGHGPWLAEVRHFDPSQIDWLASAPIVAVCAVQLRSVDDAWLSSLLDNPELTSLDLGTVELSPHQFEVLGAAGTRLAALGLWKSGPAREIEQLRGRLPLTTVFG